MNTLELITNLEKYYALKKQYPDTVEKVINMLRQQADRIAELEKQLSFMEGDYPEPTIVEKMKEYAKQSEPVAWMTEKSLINLSIPELSQITIRTDLKASKTENFNIPLYTTPHHASDVKQTKPLSDEEILEIAGKYWVNRLHYALYFARAIEAKVRGEK